MLLMLLLQATAPESPPRPAIVAEPLRTRKPCEMSPDPDEITVCGRRDDDRFRVKPIPLPAGMKTPVDGPGMDFDIGTAHGNIYADQVGRPDGIPDRRIMVTLKWPF